MSEHLGDRFVSTPSPDHLTRTLKRISGIGVPERAVSELCRRQFGPMPTLAVRRVGQPGAGGHGTGAERKTP